MAKQDNKLSTSASKAVENQKTKQNNKNWWNALTLIVVSLGKKIKTSLSWNYNLSFYTRPFFTMMNQKKILRFWIKFKQLVRTSLFGTKIHFIEVNIKEETSKSYLAMMRDLDPKLHIVVLPAPPNTPMKITKKRFRH